MRLRRVVSRMSVAAALSAFAACSRHSSDDGEVLGRQLGALCFADESCETKACAFLRCHQQCAATNDCAGGLCVHGDKGGRPVCQLDDERGCYEGRGCVGTQRCDADSVCRDTCQTETECVVGHICVDGFCRVPRPFDSGSPTGGGVLDAATCSDVVIGFACDAGTSALPTTLASEQQSPAGIAVDGTHVYWTSYFSGAGSVGKVPIDGGTTTTLASGGYNVGIAVDDTSVYWTDQAAGVVMKVSIDGGAPVTLASRANVSGSQPYGITTDATTVYFTNNYGPASSVWSVLKSGGTPKQLASGLSWAGFGIAVNGTSVFWVNNGEDNSGAGSSIMKAPLTGVPNGGAPAILASGESTNAPKGLAIDATSVYWTNQGNGTVMKVPIGGGCPTILASGQIGGPWGIAVDETSVYWTDEGFDINTGTVRKIAKAGGCITDLAKSANVLGITIDGTNVYFVSQGAGSIMKIPKN